MEGVIALATAPIILFLIIVAPIWLILHYRSRNKINAGLNDDERDTLSSLSQSAEQLQERIRTLESILDAEHPNWRRDQRGGQ